MTVRTHPRDETPGRAIDVVLRRFTQAEDLAPLLQELLDAAIALAGTDMGTMQRFDDANDCLRIVASRGFTDDAGRELLLHPSGGFHPRGAGAHWAKSALQGIDEVALLSRRLARTKARARQA